MLRTIQIRSDSFVGGVGIILLLDCGSGGVLLLEVLLVLSR